jgi:hypothetical protein
LIHLRGKEVDELCIVGKAKGKGELVGYSFQQPI